MKILLYVLSLVALTSFGVERVSTIKENELAQNNDAQGAKKIIIPKRVIKHLSLFSEKIDRKYLTLMPSLHKMLKLMEQGERCIAQSTVYEGLSELDQYLQVYPQSAPVGETKEVLDAYLNKHQKDFKELNADSFTRLAGACANTNTCAQGAPARATENASPLGNQKIKGRVVITNGTASNDCASGALTVEGGVGIGGNLNVCGQEHIFNTTQSSDCAHGALIVDGGVGIQQNLNVCGQVGITNMTQSNDCNSGALVVAGGEAIQGNLNVCGTLHVANSTASNTCADGALVVDGGIGIGDNATICGNVKVLAKTKSTKCNNGALVVTGGVGIGGNLNVCGQEHIFDRTNSTACNNGALVVDGGVGIGGNLYTCGGISAQGPIITNSYFQINNGTVLTTNLANCNLSVGDNTNPIANGTGNTAVGESAMQNNILGSDNSAFGCQALMLDVTGNDNTAGGFKALRNLNSGSQNTAWGSAASYSLDPAANTTAVGYQALYTNQIDGNTAVGSYAIHDNTYATNLTAIGYYALEHVHSADFTLPVIGTEHLYGNNNTAVGAYALNLTPYGYENVAVGVNALVGQDYVFNIPIFPPPYDANIDIFPILYQNVAIGNNALGSPYYAHDNTACGNGAIGGQYAYISYDQVAIGGGALGGAYQFINYSNCVVGNGSMGFNYLNGSSNNTTCGNGTLGSLTYGQSNTAVGNGSTSLIYFGLNNTAIGIDSLQSGGSIGPVSVASPFPMYENCAGGFQALNKTYASYNTAFGAQALQINLEGYFNTAVGYHSLQAALDEYVTAIGAYTISEGALNTLAGYAAEATGEGCVSIGAALIIPPPPFFIPTNANGAQCIAIGQSASGDGAGCIAIGGEVDGVGAGAIAIGVAASSDGAGCIAIGDGCDGAGAGAIAIGDGASADGAGTIAIGDGCESAGAGCIGMGDGVAANGAGAIAIGDGTTSDGAGCVAVGDGVQAVGLNTATFNCHTAIPDGVNLGDVWPVNQTCLLGGVPAGALNPLTVASITLGIVTTGPCPACVLPLALTEEINVVEDTGFRRTQEEIHSEKLMALKPVHYSFRQLDSEKIKRGDLQGLHFGLTEKQLTEVCPDFVTELYDEKYLSLDKLIMLMLEQLQRNQMVIEQHELQFEKQHREIEELQNRNNELQKLVACLMPKIKK